MVPFQKRRGFGKRRFKIIRMNKTALVGSTENEKQQREEGDLQRVVSHLFTTATGIRVHT